MSLAIVVPRENVNDESATLVAWTIADGQAVTAGQTVAQVETSKAVVDLAAPADGTLVHAAKVGTDVPIGAEIGRVVAAGESTTEPARKSSASVQAPAVTASLAVPATNGHGHEVALAPSVRRLVAEEKVDPSRVVGTGRDGRLTKADVLAHLERPATSATRFSREARALVERLGLDPATFAGRGLIRAIDIVPPAAPAQPAPAVAPAPVARITPVGAAGVATRTEPLPRSKRVEAKYLRSGLDATLPSVVTVACPTRGFRAAAGDLAPAILTAEVARLLRKYPVFNAYHDDGRAQLYDDVNVGFAVDAGRGLKVPVIRGADAKGVAAIADELRELVVAYLGDALSVESLSGGTFTITDLSGHGVSTFHPLINQGQAAILGVGAETFDATGQGAYNLILAFDHQLAEGRTAALFLNDLRERLAAYEAATRTGGDGGAAEEPRCGRCQSGLAELSEEGHALIPTLKADGSTRPLCTLCIQGWR